MHIRSGDVYFAEIPIDNDNPHTLSGKRPVVALQGYISGKDKSNILVAPITTNIKGLPNTIVINTKFTNNRDVEIRCDNIFRLNEKYLRDKIGYVNQNILDNIGRIIINNIGNINQIEDEKVDKEKSISANEPEITIYEKYLSEFNHINERLESLETTFESGNKASNKLNLVYGAIFCVLSAVLGFILGKI